MPTLAIANTDLMEKLDRDIAAKFNKTKAAKVKAFTRQFYASSAGSEIRIFSSTDLFELALQAWDFVQSYGGRKAKIEFRHRSSSSGGSESLQTDIYLLMKDAPFLVDSIRQTVGRLDVSIKQVNNAVIHVQRDDTKQAKPGQLREISAQPLEGLKAEAVSCIRCGYIDAELAQALEREIRETLRHVAAAVKDFKPMRKQASMIRESLLANAASIPVSQDELQESCEFIDWMLDNHFTFLGYERYQYKTRRKLKVLELDGDGLLGVSRLKTGLKATTVLADLPKKTGRLILKKNICNFAKSGIHSRVHRPAYCDYILVKEFDASGNVVTVHRFLGLYTSSVYFREALSIPLIRGKVNYVLEQSGFSANGHSIKNLLQVINVFPRDELFQMGRRRLSATALEITRIQDTRASRLFVRKDTYGKFFSCLMFMPRDNYTTENRLKIQGFLKESLAGERIDFTTYFSESSLVRIHFVLRVPTIDKVKYNVDSLEAKIVSLIKPWRDDFQEALQLNFSDKEAAKMKASYLDCFSASYQESYSADTAMSDIEHIRELERDSQLQLRLSGCQSTAGAEFSFKIFSIDSQLLLSDVTPILENLGLTIISEKTFLLASSSGRAVWLHDFSLYRVNPVAKFNAAFRQRFEQAFQAIWSKAVADDNFNALVVNADIDVRDVALLRAYASYLKQIHFAYAEHFIAETLSRNGQLSRLLQQYFYSLFAPESSGLAGANSARLRSRLLSLLDAVDNLAEDTVMRAILNLIDSTLRSNYFQREADGQPKQYFSFKIDSRNLLDLPQPRPMYEIFVFSPQMEGVHLRFGKVARGGLRWSDRSEDYRTEVLGLVKAQQVKNSVIVPVGAKGCFVIKQATPASDRQAFMAKGIECYKVFIRGLLDITDNLQKGQVVAPPDVRRRDDDDPYLVVAADKGTASFSDIANGVAEDYGFWLGDGFASGGSNGYDHKQMGITAKGAWVSVQRHFREMGRDVQKQPVSVIGIGDMSGDVFGNGMLLSKQICLLGAFNHLHIFIDPSPDPAASFRERQRLFRKSRSSWADYKSELISAGGGVFDRSAKAIKVTAAMQQYFAIEQNVVTPDQLISLLLQSPVDLIWNGGIGTYVKATAETHAQVGDKANDGLRVDAHQLRCKAIGEGGNLGFTQAARIEYAATGGISLTDFIDNSAGVDCSDHEVNIKILLNDLQQQGQLSERQRNQTLQAMTDDVSKLVLADNYAQVQAIALAISTVDFRNSEYADLITYLESVAGLDRALEGLPSVDQLEENSAKGRYLSRPEIAVVTSYMKMFLKAELVSASYLGDVQLLPFLEQAFPALLLKKYPQAIQQHPLRREIIATQIANALVNTLGPGFVYRMVDATGAPVAEVVRAAIIAMRVYGLDKVWQQVEALDRKVSTQVQNQMLLRLERLMRRLTRWLLRNRRGSLDFASTELKLVSDFRAAKNMLAGKLPAELHASYESVSAAMVAQGVPRGLADEVAIADYLTPMAGLIEIAQEHKQSSARVLAIYYQLGETLQLNSLNQILSDLPVMNHWQALARVSFIDDLSWQQRALTQNVVCGASPKATAKKSVLEWSAMFAEEISVTRLMLQQLHTEGQPDYAMFSVVLRDLLNLAQATSRAARK